MSKLNVASATDYILNIEDKYNLSIDEFVKTIIKDGLFLSELDVKKAIICSAIDVINDNKKDTPEFQIHYYEKEEEPEIKKEDIIDANISSLITGGLDTDCKLELVAEEASKIVHNKYKNS